MVSDPNDAFEIVQPLMANYSQAQFCLGALGSPSQNRGDLEFSLVDRFANCFDLFLGQLNLTGIRVGDCLVWIASAN
jgi:hypothetical protein